MSIDERDEWLEVEVFARRAGVEITFVRALVDEGLLERREGRHPARATLYVQRCVRIHRELDVEVRTVPLVLDLLDRIERLEKTRR